MIAKIQYANHNNNDAWKSILISDKVNFGKRNITRVIESYVIIIKW